ncbi:MAG: carboxypeptidase-like regulatory domain-containing protein, partial [Bryobacteraceae bacterium]|nr:carboxypeptidase-like regulatory domain-containing protein [Bryobacteraceae bacterium]
MLNHAIGMLAALMLIFPLAAQFETATVLGAIRDASQAGIPEARVQLRNVATGVATVAMTDANGNF